MTIAINSRRLPSEIVENDLETLVRLVEEDDDELLQKLEECLHLIIIRKDELPLIGQYLRSAKRPRTRLLWYCLFIINR